MCVVFRLYVISWLPQLIYLDDRIITDDQRQEANRLYGRPYYKVFLEDQVPVFMQRLMGKLKGIQFGAQTKKEEHEFCEISTNPSGSGLTNFASIPVNPQPVRLNSSDSESSTSTPRRERNLII